MRRAVALALGLLAGAPAGAQGLSSGYWVVVGSSPAPGLEWTARDDAFVAGVRARV